MSDGTQEHHIAVIGMACRFPGAPDLGSFWELLRDGREGIRHYTKKELLDTGIPPEWLEDPNYVRSYGFLEDHDKFDARFFGYTSLEAQIMDPQQRLFLEVAWAALEHAGYDPSGLQVPVGVFAGAGQNAYRLRVLSRRPDLLSEGGDFFNTVNNDNDFIATRVAYKLNLRGPGLTVQTACSTSLVATHLAVQSLLNHECDIALAGGATVVTSGKEGYFYIQEGTFSPDGHTRAFDAQASGMVGGDGAGAVVLKRLEDALADRNSIYGVILGSAINNDGSGKVGFTAPSVSGQARAILEAQLVAGIKPSQISFIEGHGTGTALGDPIEVRALTETFRRETQATGYCALGSVKTNIGHTGAAAGVAGLIKACLALHHKQIPPSLHFQKPNPELKMEESPFYVNTSKLDWQPRDGRRLAGISSFGIGGTNAHLILEESPGRAVGKEEAQASLFTWSGLQAGVLESLEQKYAAFLEQDTDFALSDISYTMNLGRKAFGVRRYAIAASKSELAEVFRNPRPYRQAEMASPLAWMLPGMGGLTLKSGADLYRTEKVFRRALDTCAELALARIHMDIRDGLFQESNSESGEPSQLGPEWMHAAHFAYQYAAGKLLFSLEIHPDAILAQSVGEFAAAALAGVFSLDDAVAMVCLRGELVAGLPAGAMVSVSISPDRLSAILPAGLELAVENTPNLCVVSGPKSGINEFTSLLVEKGIDHRRLQIPFASHTSFVDPIIAPFLDGLRNLHFKSTRIPIVSCTTGKQLSDAEVRSPEYWAHHLMRKVNVWRPAKTLIKEGYLLVDVGPGNALSTLLRSLPSETENDPIVSLASHPRRGEPERRTWLNAIGDLWSRGTPVRMESLYGDQNPYRVGLPTYPFERKRHWAEVTLESNPRYPSSRLPRKHDLKDWFYQPTWKRTPFPQPAGFTEPGRWLLFGAGHPLGSALQARLEKQGHHVAVVNLGQGYEVDNGCYTLNPTDAGDYRRLLADLDRAGLLPVTTVIHMAGLTSDPMLSGTREEHIGGALEHFYFSHLHLAQGLAEHQPAQSLRYLTLTQGGQDVFGGDLRNPGQILGLAAVKVLPLEYETVSALSLDLEPTVNPPPDRLAGRIIAEAEALTHRDHTKQVAAYRGSHRWEQDFEQFSIREAPAPGLFKAGGHYFITGGLGGIGLALGEFLAENFQARLVLVSRSSLPDRSDLESGQQPPASDAGRQMAAIASILRMKAHGANVLHLKADVTERSQLMAALQAAKDRFGPLNGVIHAAGVPSGGVVELKTRAQSRENMAAKLEGSLLLTELIDLAELDFTVFCSSLASITSGYGQLDYTAANNYQDALATYLSSKGTKAVSINWDTWRESGMAVWTEVPEALRAQRKDSLQKGLTDQEGKQAFQVALNSGLPQVLISTQDFRERYRGQVNIATMHTGLENVPREESNEKLEHPPNPVPEFDRSGISADFRSPQNETEKVVAQAWERLFGMAPIGIQDDFFELGGHSLLATQLLNKLRGTFPEVTFSLARFFDGPTVSKLSAWITRERNWENLPPAPDLKSADPAERQTRILEFVHSFFAKAGPGPGSGAGLPADEVWMAEFIDSARQKLGFPVYPHEIRTAAGQSELAAYLLEQFDIYHGLRSGDLQVLANPLPVPEPETRASGLPEKNPPMIFILSAPRSGSTLLRLMMAGFPELFCPPEIGLLAFDHPKAWYGRERQTFQFPGYVHALSDTSELELREARDQVETWVSAGKSVNDLYRQIQEGCHPRILVDKTPGYAAYPETLNKAEAWFREPKYIHLVRHPAAVIDSIARHRIHALLGSSQADPHMFGEHIWKNWNRNILDFLEGMPRNRWHFLRFEEIVMDPEGEMRRLADFLQIPFSPEALAPYSRGRMLSGPGDPDIVTHDTIVQKKGEEWKRVRLPHKLEEETLSLAGKFRYSPSPETAFGSASSLEVEIEGLDVDSLTDEEVDRLLEQLLEEED